jgi:hypothetical protein
MLKRTSCCCGATKSNPCACMKKGIMKCSSKAPMCQCYKDLKKQGKHPADLKKAFITGWSVIKNNPRLPTEEGAKGVGRALNFHDPEIVSGFSHRGIPRDLPKPKPKRKVSTSWRKKPKAYVLPEDDPESEEFDPYKDRGE